MIRHHTIKITRKMWQDKELVQRIKAQAREHAGRHPGMMVTVKRQSDYSSYYETVWRFLNVSWEPQEW